MPIKIIRGNDLEHHDMMNYVYEAWKMTDKTALGRYLRASSRGWPKTKVSRDLLWLAEVVNLRND